MQGIATAQEFFMSRRTAEAHISSPRAMPQSAAARVYGGTQKGTTPLQQATLKVHREAVKYFKTTISLHRDGRFVQSELERSHGMALLVALRRSVNLGSSTLANELFRIYHYLIERLEEEPLDRTDAAELALNAMQMLTEAWETRYRSTNVVSLMGSRIGRLSQF